MDWFSCSIYGVLGDLLGNQLLGILVGNVVCFVLIQATVILLFVRMGISARQGNRNAQLLLIPFTFQGSLGVLAGLTLTLCGRV